MKLFALALVLCLTAPACFASENEESTGLLSVNADDINNDDNNIAETEGTELLDHPRYGSGGGYGHSGGYGPRRHRGYGRHHRGYGRRHRGYGRRHHGYGKRYRHGRRHRSY
eukprot:432054_1